MKPSEEGILQALETHDRRKKEEVRQMLLAEGRPDLVADLDRRIRDIETGIDGARATWNALSEAQRRSLRFASENGGKLYFGTGGYGSARALPEKSIRLPTARNLIARELLACDGGAFDPEKVLVLTERGRFVLKHGPEAIALESEAKKKGRGK